MSLNLLAITQSREQRVETPQLPGVNTVSRTPAPALVGKLLQVSVTRGRGASNTVEKAALASVLHSSPLTVLRVRLISFFKINDMRWGSLTQW